MLPVAIGGISTISGFIAGYYYNGSSQTTQEHQISCNVVDSDSPIITEKTLMVLKKRSPHREINKELIEFDKKKLKKFDSSENIKVMSAEEEIFERIKQSIQTRRKCIELQPSMT